LKRKVNIYSSITINGCKIIIYKGEWFDEMFIKITPQKVNELKKEAKNGKVSHLSGEKPKE